MSSTVGVPLPITRLRLPSRDRRFDSMKKRHIMQPLPQDESWVKKMLKLSQKHAALDDIEPFFDAPLEIKEVSADGTFQGYGAVFGNVDFGRDVIAPGAFSKTLAKKKASQIKLLWQHDPTQPIGVWEELVEDKRGLLVKGRLLIGQGVPKADEAYALLKAGALDGMSIGFEIPEGGATFDDKKRVRTINSAHLWEVSLVTFPLNATATSYKLPIADVIGGELTAVPRGIFAAAGALLGARGGVDIPAEAKRRIASHLERYYSKLDMEAPFKAIDMGEAIKSAVHARLARS